MTTKKEPITAKSLTKELMTKEKMDYVIYIIKEFQGICSRMNKINQSLETISSLSLFSFISIK